MYVVSGTRKSVRDRGALQYKVDITQDKTALYRYEEAICKQAQLRQEANLQHHLSLDGRKVLATNLSRIIQNPRQPTTSHDS